MNKKILAVASCLTVTGTMAFADPATFGPLPQATFNPTGADTGNPNSAVEIDTFQNAEVSVTLGLAAQQRYSNPALGNNGAGTFFATPGANVQGPSATLGSTWNVDFYVHTTGLSDLGTFTLKLFYDFDPAANTPKSQMGVINLNAANVAAGGSSGGNTLQDSENLLFSFFATPTAGIVTPPTGVTSFDPNAVGEYSFILEADLGNTEVAEADIQVDVTAVPDVSATAPMFALALGTLGVVGARKQRRQASR
jgi:hypothetical protein